VAEDVKAMPGIEVARRWGIDRSVLYRIQCEHNVWRHRRHKYA
jgi:hypothetical protein